MFTYENWWSLHFTNGPRTDWNSEGRHHTTLVADLFTKVLGKPSKKITWFFGNFVQIGKTPHPHVGKNSQIIPDFFMRAFFRRYGSIKCENIFHHDGEYAGKPDGGEEANAWAIEAGYPMLGLRDQGAQCEGWRGISFITETNKGGGQILLCGFCPMETIAYCLRFETLAPSSILVGLRGQRWGWQSQGRAK